VESDDHRSLEIQFEELIADPEESAEMLASFCGMPSDPDRVRDCLSLVQPERGNAYLKTWPAALQALAAKGLSAETVARRLGAYGYAL